MFSVFLNCWLENSEGILYGWLSKQLRLALERLKIRRCGVMPRPQPTSLLSADAYLALARTNVELLSSVLFNLSSRGKQLRGSTPGLRAVGVGSQLKVNPQALNPTSTASGNLPSRTVEITRKHRCLNN